MSSDAAAVAVAALEAEEAAEAKETSEEDNDNNHSSPITVTVTSGSTQYIAMAGKFKYYVYFLLDWIGLSRFIICETPIYN